MKQIDLANAIGVSKQIMSKMLNGSRLISIAELHKIGDYFCVTMDDLLKAPVESTEVDVMRAFMGKVLFLQILPAHQPPCPDWMYKQ